MNARGLALLCLVGIVGAAPAVGLAEEGAAERVALPAQCSFIGCWRSQPTCEAMPRQVCLDAFAIDRTEVTVAAYRACVEAGRCRPPPDKSTIGWCSYHRPDHDGHPVDCVLWAEAQAYCVWRGGRLPTEAEFERAGRGKIEAPFPWGGDAPSCERAHSYRCSKDELDRTLPVCSRPRGNSPDGLCDMSGNANEWVYDWYVRPADEQRRSRRAAGAEEPPRNPRGPCAGKARCNQGPGHHATKGGGVDLDVAEALELGYRGSGWLKSGRPRVGLGFRCVYPAAAAK